MLHRACQERTGYPSNVVYSSSTALEEVVADQPDVFITDIGMPRLNGCKLARQVRSLCRQAPLTIAITGYDNAQIREQCLQAGFDHFFVKPAGPNNILTVLRQYAERLSAETLTGSEKRRQVSIGTSIAIVIEPRACPSSFRKSLSSLPTVGYQT